MELITMKDAQTILPLSRLVINIIYIDVFLYLNLQK